MKEVLGILKSLTAIFIVAGLLIAVVFANTAPVIIEAERLEKEAALKAMAPEADSIVKAGEWEPYPKKKDEYFNILIGNEVTGYIISTQGKGYQSFIKILVALNLDHTIRRINVVWQGETPGFGEEIEKPEFKDRFTGKMLQQMELVMIDDPDKIQAITGVTVSSKGVVDGVRKALEIAKERFPAGKGLSNGVKSAMYNRE